MSFTSTLSSAPISLSDRFRAFMGPLAMLVCGLSNGGAIRFEVGQLIKARIGGRVRLVLALIEALRAGMLRTRRSPVPGLSRRPAAAPEIVLPRECGWLRRFVPSHMLPIGSLALFLEDPELAGLLAASPRLVRALKPLCRMIGVPMPKPVPAPVSPSPVPPPARSRRGAGGPAPEAGAGSDPVVPADAHGASGRRARNRRCR